MTRNGIGGVVNLPPFSALSMNLNVRPCSLTEVTPDRIVVRQKPSKLEIDNESRIGKNLFVASPADLPRSFV
jgi:hypothetical protein